MRGLGADLSRAYFNLEQGALRSVKELVVHPEVVFGNYIAGARVRYFSPAGFLIANVAFASLMVAVTGFQFVSTSGTPNATMLVIQRNPNLTFLLQVPLLALLCRLLFLEAGLNYAEFLVIAAYTSGLRTLFLTLVALPIWVLIRHSAILPAATLCYVGLWLVYFSFAVRRLVPHRTLFNCLRGALAVLLTLLASAFFTAWLIS